jgi:membrane protein
MTLTTALQLWFANVPSSSAYGSMGTLVLLLVWMYYAAVVFFVGALITAVIDERSLRVRTPGQQDADGQDVVE